MMERDLFAGIRNDKNFEHALGDEIQRYLKETNVPIASVEDFDAVDKQGIFVDEDLPDGSYYMVRVKKKD